MSSRPPTSSPTTAAAAAAPVSAELLALQRTRNALRADTSRVSETLRELLSSDERFLTHSEQNSSEYTARLAAAEKQVKAIAERERLDNRILWWSFALFFVVVAYIWSQRALRLGF